MSIILEILIKIFCVFGIVTIGLVLLYLIFRLITLAIAKSWIEGTIDQQTKQNGGKNHGEEKEEE